MLASTASLNKNEQTYHCEAAVKKVVISGVARGLYGVFSVTMPKAYVGGLFTVKTPVGITRKSLSRVNATETHECCYYFNYFFVNSNKCSC